MYNSLIIDFDPNNREHCWRFHNDPEYHALVYLAAFLITRMPMDCSNAARLDELVKEVIWKL